MSEASPEASAKREATTTATRARERPGRAAVASRRSGRAPGEPRRVAYLYIFPGLAAYLIFTFFPLLQTVWLSFFNWDGVTPKAWRGLGNYRELWNTPEIRDGFQHSVELILFYAIFSIAIGLFLTALLTRFKVRGFLFFRTVLFMPQTIATVVVAQAFTWIYDPSGPLDEFLRKVGLGYVAKTWLGDFAWALPAVGLIGTWITFGLCVVLFLAGAQRIPSELYEAARVDGAGFVREFFAVTLPGLRNEVVVAATLTTITALRNFDIIYNTTSGGPGGETEVPSWLMFHNAFDINRVGFAASIAVVLTVIITCVALMIGRLSRPAA
ncbi:MAG: sugar ABC transporter permease [Actinomycetota bacterium]|nr:sugar ABC transporter permease [Actinomycetota bacterium]